MPQFNKSVEATEKFGSEMSKLPEHVDTMKRVGDDFMNSRSYSLAINQYSECIKLLPNHPLLYSKRAIAYKLRGFVGDSYVGLRDCQQALRLDPTFVEAHFIQVDVFTDLKFFMEARKCLNYFKKWFPKYAKCETFQHLAQRIEVLRNFRVCFGNVFLNAIDSFSRYSFSQQLDLGGLIVRIVK